MFRALLPTKDECNLCVATRVRLWIRRLIKLQTVQPAHHIANKSLKVGNLQAVKQASFKIGTSNETVGFSDSEKVRQGSVHAIRYVCEHTFLSVCWRAVHGTSIWEDSWKTISPKQPSKQQLGFVELIRAIPAPLCWYCDLMCLLFHESWASHHLSSSFPSTFREQTRPLSVTQYGWCFTYCANVTAFVQEDRCGVNLYAECVRRYKFAVVHSLLSHLVAAVGLIVVRNLRVCDWKKRLYSNLDSISWIFLCI